MKVCSEHADGRAPSVSLLVPVDLESRPPSMSAARAEGLLRAATALFEGAGIHLEDIVLADDDADFVGQLVRSGDFDALLVCPAHRKASSPVLPLAVQLARLHGLTVDDDGRPGGRDELAPARRQRADTADESLGLSAWPTGAQRPDGVPHQPGAVGRTTVFTSPSLTCEPYAPWLLAGPVSALVAATAAAVARSHQPFEHG